MGSTKKFAHVGIWHSHERLALLAASITSHFSNGTSHNMVKRTAQLILSELICHLNDLRASPHMLCRLIVLFSPDALVTTSKHWHFKVSTPKYEPSFRISKRRGSRF